MYYKFQCGNFCVMSDVNRNNLTLSPEMLGKYYTEKLQKIL